MVRRVDPHGKALVWCRKCSCHARCRLGPKLMVRCRPEKMDTKEDGKMIKRILILEEGKVSDMISRGWKVDWEKKRVSRKECKRLRGEFEVGGFYGTEKGLWNLAKKEDVGRPRSVARRRRIANQILQDRARRKNPKQLALGGCGGQRRTNGESEQESRRRRSEEKRDMGGVRRRRGKGRDKQQAGLLLVTILVSFLVVNVF